MLIRKILILFLMLLTYCKGYKLLVVFPIPNKSHSFLGAGYVRHLLKAGHEVTYITPVPITNALDPALRQIDVSKNNKYYSTDVMDISKLMYKEISLSDHFMWRTALIPLYSGTFKLDVVQKLMEDPAERFDAVIVEWAMSELGAGFATVFDCPLIWSSSLVTHSYVLSLINEHLNPAYTVHYLAESNSFTFLDRVQHLWTDIVIAYRQWQLSYEENAIFEDVFGAAVAKRGRKLPYFDEVRYSASLILGNSNPFVGDLVALPQNYKDVGGYHIKEILEPLPPNLQSIMNNAKNGVIYFSLGSNLKSSDMPLDLKRRFLDMFSELDQIVIWKIEEVLPNLPKNVHTVTWAPQESILAHPNCILFITHGGLLSLLESVYFGVPVIGMPLFGDQFVNIGRAVMKGFGKRLDLSDDSPAALKMDIEEILNNPRYRQRVKELSVAYHDRLVSPGRELTYWVEHVVKTGGAPHLKSVALQMEWYKRLYLDLAVILVLSLILGISLTAFCVKSLIQLSKSIKIHDKKA